MKGELIFFSGAAEDSPPPARSGGFLVAIVTAAGAMQVLKTAVRPDLMITLATDDAAVDTLSAALTETERDAPTLHVVLAPARRRLRRDGAWQDADRDPRTPDDLLAEALQTATDRLIAQGVTDVLVRGDHGAMTDGLADEARMALIRQMTGRGTDISGPRFTVEGVPSGAPGLLNDWLAPAALPRWIAGPALGSIAVPCTRPDVPALARLFRLWCDPRMTPSRRIPRPRPALLIVLNTPYDAMAEKAVRAAAADTPELEEIFSEIAVEFAGLTGARDLYVRDGSRKAAPLGQKAGPNNLFFETMTRAARFGSYAFLNEVDCIPLMPGWLDALEEIAAARPHRWVVGASYLGNATMRSEFLRQINGNALYHVGREDFRTFMSDVWQPRLAERIKEYPMLAYDCWWSLEVSLSDAKARNAEWFLVQAHNDSFESLPFLLNAAHTSDTAQVTLDRYVHNERRGSAAILLHGVPVPALVEAFLSERQSSPLGLLRQGAEAEAQAEKPADPADLRLFETLHTTSGAFTRSQSGVDEAGSRTISMDDTFRNPAFHPPEKEPDGTTFSWIGKTGRGDITVDLRHDGLIEVAVHILHAIGPEMVTGLHIGCDGIFAETSTIVREGGMTIKSARIAVPDDDTDQVVVNLRADVIKDMTEIGDPRTLAVAVHKIVLTPLDKNPADPETQEPAVKEPSGGIRQRILKSIKLT